MFLIFTLLSTKTIVLRIRFSCQRHPACRQTTRTLNVIWGPLDSDITVRKRKTKSLKLYCRYEYTKPCMINRIWGLKQQWLQVNGRAWFHLQRLRWPVRNGVGARNSKWKYMSPAGFEPTPRQSTTGKSVP